MIRWLATAAAVLAVGAGAWAAASRSAPSPVEQPVDPDSLYDPIVAGESFDGGIRWVVNRDGIKPVYSPEFVEASESPLVGEDLVLGLALGGDVRA